MIDGGLAEYRLLTDLAGHCRLLPRDQTQEPLANRGPYSGAWAGRRNHLLSNLAEYCRPVPLPWPNYRFLTVARPNSVLYVARCRSRS